MTQTIRSDSSAKPPGENVLWEGSPSQWKILGWWLSCILILPIPVAIWKSLWLKNYRIVLTSQRLRIRWGIFSKSNEDIELYRVKDWTLSEPLFQRITGSGTVNVVSSDRTSPDLTLDWIKEPAHFIELLRHAVEEVRDSKRVRELDVGDSDVEGDGMLL